MTDLGARLQREADAFPARVGYVVTDLSTGERFGRNESEAFPTTSSIKLPVLTSFHSVVQLDEHDWDDEVAIDPRLSFGGSGVLQYLTLPGAESTIAVTEEQQGHETLHRYLPADPFSPGALRVAEKSGALPGISSGVAKRTRGDRRVAVAVLVDGADDTTASVENESERLISRMTRLACDASLATDD